MIEHLPNDQSLFIVDVSNSKVKQLVKLNKLSHQKGSRARSCLQPEIWKVRIYYSSPIIST